MGFLHQLLRGRKPAAPAPRERRRSPRYNVLQPADIYVTHRPLQGTMVDVSQSGARIATRFPRDPDAVVGLEIQVDGRALVLPLLLLWMHMVEGQYHNGRAFVDLNGEEQAQLDRYVDLAVQQRGSITQRLNIA